MKTIKEKMLLLISGLFLSSALNAQKIVTEYYSVAGNCGMCKKTIEKAATIDGVKSATWDQSKKNLVVKYDKAKTKGEIILHKVAFSGYDNQMYLAPDAAYTNLHECCQYERKGKPAANTTK
jgi:mercuric ion binding protein